MTHGGVDNYSDPRALVGCGGAQVACGVRKQERCNEGIYTGAVRYIVSEPTEESSYGT